MLNSQFVSRVSLNRAKIESADVYPFSTPAIRAFDSIDLHPKLTFFVGENGSGKSTLLEAIAIACGFNPEGGTTNFSFGTRASHSPLHDFLRIAKGIKKPRGGFFLRAESFFNVATEIERLDAEPSFGPPLIDAYGGRSLHEQSHGEAFLALLNHRFHGQGLYILDEPEAALSPQRQLAALSRMHDLILEGAQFIVATHSPILMAYPDAQIFHFGAEGVKPIEYEDTEHFQVTRDFITNPTRMLKVLLDRAK